MWSMVIIVDQILQDICTDIYIYTIYTDTFVDVENSDTSFL